MGFFDNFKPTKKESSGIEHYTGPRYEHVHYEPQQVEWMTMEDLKAEANLVVTHQKPPTLIFDVECYPNFFYVGFKSLHSGKFLYIWSEVKEDGSTVPPNPALMSYIYKHFTLIGFNSISYDKHMCDLMVSGCTVPDLHYWSSYIIGKKLSPYGARKATGCPNYECDHIDVIEVAPLKGSLKLYAGRMMVERMQDLPFDPLKRLTLDEKKAIAIYNVNDLDETTQLYETLYEQIQLRSRMSETYGMDLRSKSDAQIAEAVLRGELKKNGLTHIPAVVIPDNYSFKYEPPAYMEFQTPELQLMFAKVKEAKFTLKESGHVQCPKEIEELTISIGPTTFNLVIGGLHSQEKGKSHYAKDGYRLFDVDVTSYYPYIIINQGLYPKHLGKYFLTAYTEVVNSRVEAKRLGHKVVDSSLKIVINGSFGKLGNNYSILYSPDLLVAVTIGGQLSLLMLIEMLHLKGIAVVSGNTDGIVIKPKEEQIDTMRAVVKAWEKKTSFNTEETEYKSIHSQAVNDYLAVCPDGSIKKKGKLGYYDYDNLPKNNFHLHKNPKHPIVQEAVGKYFAEGIPVAETILACNDIRKFVCVKRVTGGAEKDGVYVGTIIRWYYKLDVTTPIRKVINGDKVPESDGAWPLMQLPKTFPKDVDKAWYINRALKCIIDMGISPSKLCKVE